MSDEILDAKKVLELEAKALLDLRDKIGNEFKVAIDILLGCKSKVILTGMGKSGLIARKIASTLCSTGTPSVYIHPAESSHGDLGVISSDDVILALSHSGETLELDNLIKYASRKDIPIISMTKSKKSALGKASKITLEVDVKDDACPMGLVPTSSTTATLALGDALAVALLKRKGFKQDDFAEFHPGGSLGKRLLTRVHELMHSGDSLQLVTEDMSMKDVVVRMTKDEVRGVAGVVNPNGELIGIITDGDIRRHLDENIKTFERKAGEIMTSNPKIISKDELAERAMLAMEKSAIQSLFVMDESNKPVGVIHIQDLIKANIR